MRIQWTDDDIKRSILESASKLGTSSMPTASQMRAQGQNALACTVSRRGGFDYWAKVSGLSLAQHDSRKGWVWEEWFAELARSRGLSVKTRERVKDSYDLIVNEKTVDVKSANPSHDGHQWTWRIAKAHTVDVYVFIAIQPKVPPALFFRPASETSETCVTARRGVLGWNSSQQWLNRWDLLC